MSKVRQPIPRRPRINLGACALQGELIAEYGINYQSNPRFQRNMDHLFRLPLSKVLDSSIRYMESLIPSRMPIPRRRYPA